MFTQKYKLVYLDTKTNKIYASTDALPSADDKVVIEDRKSFDGKYKLVYEDENQIKGSVTGIPAEGDDVIYTVEADEVGEDITEDTNEDVTTEEPETEDPEDEPTVEEGEPEADPEVTEEDDELDA